MKRKSLSIKVFLSLIILISFTDALFSADASVLDELTIKAREGNPLICAAEERVLQADGALREAGAKMGPKLGAGVAALWPRNRITPIEGLPFSFGNVYAAAAGFIQTIYAGGSLSAAREAAKLTRDAAEAEKERISQTVVNSVRIAYYNWKTACDKEKVAQEALGLAKDHLARAEKLFKSGIIAKGDVLRTKVAVADAELTCIRAENAVEISVSALERAVGSPLDRKEIEKEKSSPGIVQLPAQPSDPEGDIMAAYNNRMEIKMYDLMNRRAIK
ncbi:MAG: TolC family protein, partial [Synergistaceae bacterium]|nr:TolC family protein [Synergistaceae bacterium]